MTQTLEQQPVVPQQPMVVPQQPVVAGQQPVVFQQPVVMQPVATQQPLVGQTGDTHRPGMPEPPTTPSLRIYGHSHFLYWWPVWVVGYIMAALTYVQGQVHEIGNNRELFHPSSNLGVIFFATLFLVILMTNFTVRGLASGMVILGAAFLTVLFAYLGWWDTILGWFGELKINMNCGAYFWFSTVMFMTWCISVFLVDHMTYFQVEPGQVTRNYVFGAGSQSYNTQGMMLEKHRADLFQNWLLGLGSGNLVIRTSGASHEVIEVPNVMFIGWKVEAMEQLIAMEPAVPGQG
jgi:hypothetical protein